MLFGRKVQDPDDPQRGKAWAAGAGVALTVMSLGLLTWMAIDVDNDGRSSYSEFRSGTSPMHGDTDGDGVADGWELDHGFDALSAASRPDLGPGGTGDAVDDVTECSIQDLLLDDCEDGPGDDGSASPPSADAGAAPPAGGNGSVGTLALGGGTTLVAGVAARLISAAILHK